MLNLVMGIYCLFKMLIEVYILSKNRIVNYEYPVDLWLTLLLGYDAMWLCYSVLCLCVQSRDRREWLFLDDSFIFLKRHSKKRVEGIDT